MLDELTGFIARLRCQAPGETEDAAGQRTFDGGVALRLDAGRRERGEELLVLGDAEEAEDGLRDLGADAVDLLQIFLGGGCELFETAAA